MAFCRATKDAGTSAPAHPAPRRRFGRLLGVEKPFLQQAVQVVIDLLGYAYPEGFVGREDFILKVVEMEETRFSQTLTVGLRLLDELIASAKAAGRAELAGEDVFRLYDTYGFSRPDRPASCHRKAGLTVDLTGF